MMKLVTGILKFGCMLSLALSVGAPTCLVAQQATPSTAIQLKEKLSVTAPVYDVATIKRGNWGLHGGPLQSELKFSDDSFIAREQPLFGIICEAYGMEGYRVSGGPEWVSSWHDGYDVTAKTTEESTVETLNKMAPKRAKLVHEQMLQALLADRFKLTIHRETKQLPMSVLVISKGGLKIQPTKAAVTGSQDVDNSPNPSMSGESTPDGELRTAKDFSMDQVAEWLAGALGHPVKNMTGLNGVYDFRVRYSSEDLGSSTSSFPAPLISAAIQDQLGLKVESRVGPVETIVIDHVERPSEN